MGIYSTILAVHKQALCRESIRDEIETSLNLCDKEVREDGSLQSSEGKTKG